MRRFYLFVSLLFLLSSSLCNAGERTSRLKLTSDKGDYRGNYIPARPGTSGISLGYRSVKFLNPVFFNNIDKDVLDNRGEVDLSYQIFLHSHLALEVGGFVGFFDYGDWRIDHEGLEFFLDYYVLPDMGKFTRYFCPYIGVGYQTSHLKVGSYGDDDKSSSSDNPSIGTGGLQIKGGLTLFLGRSIFLKAEYRQSLPANDEKLSRAIELGFGITINR